jgi:hypothetical protein
MGSKRTTTNTTNESRTSNPMTMVMPGFQNITNRVNEALNNLPASTYSGPFVAIPGQERTQALIDSYDLNAGRAEAAGGRVLDAANRLSTPISFQQNNLPTLSRFEGDNGGARLDAAIRGSINPVMRQLQEQILPSIKSSAIESGAYSGDRAMGVVPELAIAESMERANDIASRLAYEGFQQEEGRRLSAHQGYQDQLLSAFNLDTQRGLGAGELETRRLGMLPDFEQQAMQLYAGQSDLMRMGLDTETARQQALVADALAREDYATQAQFRGLGEATDILTRLTNGYGTQTGNSTSKTVEKTGGLGPIVQGAMGLASMAAGLGAFGGAGALAGAAGGASGAAAAAPAYMNTASSLFGRRGPV